MAARVGPSTSFYREGIVQHGQSPRLMVVSSPGLELLPVCADKAHALLPLCNLSPATPNGTLKSITIYSPRRVTAVFLSGLLIFFFPFTHTR